MNEFVVGKLSRCAATDVQISPVLSTKRCFLWEIEFSYIASFQR